MRVTLRIVLTVGILVGTAGAASAAITINEVKAKSPEFVELYNSSPVAVDVSGWSLVALFSPPEVLPAGSIVPGGGFFVHNPAASFMSNSGDILQLVDVAGNVVDQVGYGNRGGAPLGFNSFGRSPDGDDTDDDARDFEYLDDSIDANAMTPGMPNKQGVPALGSGLLLNEIDINAFGGFDHVEIYNPTAVPISLQGYYLSDGDGFCSVTGAIVVPGGGVVLLTEDSVGEGMDCGGFDDISISGSDTFYLFAPEGGGAQGLYPVRIDQLGLNTNAPPLGLGDTFQRCPDGAGPNDGYDYPSSGGGVSYIVGPQTLGLFNFPNCTPTQAEPSTWGQVKGTYR
jgi:hypothetical protein